MNFKLWVQFPTISKILLAFRTVGANPTYATTGLSSETPDVIASTAPTLTQPLLTPNWGDNGYYKLKKDSPVICGTSETPFMENGCVDDGKNGLHVCGQCRILFDVGYCIRTIYITEP